MAVVLLLLIPVVRSYLGLLGQLRPARVSKRRVRLIVIHSLLPGLAWAVSFYLMISNAIAVNGIDLLMVMFFLGFGAAALMPSLPLAAFAYFAPMLLAAAAAAWLNDILRPDLLNFVSVAGAGAIAWSAWQSWRESTASVRLGLEKIRAEAEVHERESARSINSVISRESIVISCCNKAARSPASQILKPS